MLGLYTAPPTVARFSLSPALVRGIVGPVGSGKTTGCLFELFRRAIEQEPGPDNVRRTRFAIIRNTLSQLKMTVLPDARAYFGELFQWKVSESMGMLEFDLDDGTRIRSEWLFIPLDDPDDVRRLLSLQLTGAFIEEFRETDFAILAPLVGRVGRYPTMGVKPTWQGVIMSSNPYPNGSEWHEVWEVELPEGWDFFRQPSGTSPEAENVENLPVGYYARLMHGASPEWVKVHVHGQNGSDQSGMAVFGSVFHYDFHVKHGLQVREASTVLIGMDTDRNPACVLAQRGVGTGLRVLDAIWGEGIGLETFIELQLKPLLYERYATCPVVLIIDPAGAKRDSITEESQLQALQRLNFDAMLAPTNNIEPRLRAVDELLSRQYGGEAAVVFDAIGAVDLIRALMGNYKYPRSAKGQISSAPEKKHPWSDLVDGLGYLALGQSAAGRGFPLPIRRRGVRVAPPPPPAGGWT